MAWMFDDLMVAEECSRTFDSKAVQAVKRALAANADRIEALDIGYGIDAWQTPPTVHPDGSVTIHTVYETRRAPRTTLTD